MELTEDQQTWPTKGAQHLYETFRNTIFTLSLFTQTARSGGSKKVSQVCRKQKWQEGGKYSGQARGPQSGSGGTPQRGVWPLACSYSVQTRAQLTIAFVTCRVLLCSNNFLTDTWQQLGLVVCSSLDRHSFSKFLFAELLLESLNFNLSPLGL